MRRRRHIDRFYTDDEMEDDLEEEDEAVMGDIYDLYAESIKGHSPIGKTHIHEDMFLSNLNGQGAEGDEEKFVREQIKLSLITRKYIKDPKEAHLAQHLIMIDAQNIAGFSRARKGMIIKSILNYGQPKAIPEIEQHKGALAKLLSKKKQEEE